MKSICAEWQEQRLKHPFFGENFSKKDILDMWNKASSTYSDTRYAEIRKDMVRDLLSTGVITSSDTILDIGCGPGSFSIALSPYVKEVHSMDASEGMLAELSKRSGAQGINNIFPILRDWDLVGADKRYDVVLTSLCPSTNSPESLMRMELAANRKCVYISSINERASIPMKIWNLLERDYSFSGYNTQYPHQYLKEIGRNAYMKVYSQTNHVCIPYEIALKDEIGRFAQYGISEAEVKDVAENVLQSFSNDGNVVYDYEMKMGMLVWDVKITS